MTSNTSLFTKSLGQSLGDATHICDITASTGAIGINLSVVQVSGLDRNYRVSVPPNATGSGVWRRLVPYDKTEKFTNQNHWAVDMTCVNNVTTLRLVRTRAGTPPASTTLKCNVKALPSVGASVAIANSTTTTTNATNGGIYDGALITQIDGMVGINTDSPSYELDVLGNVNISQRYKIGGVDVLTASALGNNIMNSNLTSVGVLTELRTSGNVRFTGLGTKSETGNVLYIDTSTGQLHYGAPAGGSGNVSVDNLHSNQVVNADLAYRIGNVNVLTASALGNTVLTSALNTVGTLSSLTVTGNVTAGNVSAIAYAGTRLSLTGNATVGNISATSITGTLSTAAQPNITSIGGLSSLTVAGNVTAGNVSATSLAGILTTAAQPNITSFGNLSSLNVTGGVTASTLAGTLSTAAQPNITSVGSLSTLAVTGNVVAGNVSGTTLTGTNLVGTLSTVAQPNITSVGTLSALNVTGNVRAGNTITVGAAEVWDGQNQSEKWRLMVSSDGAGNYFQLENFVSSQWQGVVRIDK